MTLLSCCETVLQAQRIIPAASFEFEPGPSTSRICSLPGRLYSAKASHGLSTQTTCSKEENWRSPRPKGPLDHSSGQRPAFISMNELAERKPLCCSLATSKQLRSSYSRSGLRSPQMFTSYLAKRGRLFNPTTMMMMIMMMMMMMTMITMTMLIMMMRRTRSRPMTMMTMMIMTTMMTMVATMTMMTMAAMMMRITWMIM